MGIAPHDLEFAFVTWMEAGILWESLHLAMLVGSVGAAHAWRRPSNVTLCFLRRFLKVPGTSMLMTGSDVDVRT